MIQVRPVTVHDAEAWLRMREELWPDEAESLRSDIDQFFAGSLRMLLATLLAVDEAGSPIGMIELSIRPYAEGCETDRVAFVEGWFVVPDARRRGVGRALMSAAERWAHGQGCSELASDALLDNSESAAAHRALGFSEIEQIRCFHKALGPDAPTRADALIRELELQPHPESGYFAETFRSAITIEPPDGRGTRAAVTTIYYLLHDGAISLWHRVTSDELWHYYEGAPLELLVLSPDGSTLTRHRLGPVDQGGRPAITVAAHEWQAARSTGEYTLAGCTVAPGFEYVDFTLARELPSVAADIRSRHPDTAGFI